jgi:hypothetical protein
MHKTLLRNRRESLGWSRGHVLDLMKDYGFSGSGHKILFIEDRRTKSQDEAFLRCLCKVLDLNFDDVARELEIVPEKIKKAYFEGKIQYEEGH